MLGAPREACAQAAVLRGHARRAGVALAVALHEAAAGDERHRGEAELLGAEKRRHRHVAAAHELAVGLEHHARAQAVAQERLLRLGKADLERDACVVDGVARGGAGAAVVPGDEDLVGPALGDARGDGAHAREGAELHRDAGAGVGALEVEYQLGEVLDRVDVVVRRRRDEAHAGRGLAHLGDPRVDLLAGQVAALARLGALRHLDLDLGRRDQVAARHAEAPGRDLLDRGARGVPVRARRLARRVLPSLAAVGAAVQAVHGHGETLVLLAGDRSVAHRAGVEASHDLARGLHLLKRHGVPGGQEAHEVAQGDGAAGSVHPGGVLLEKAVVPLAAGALQQVDGLGEAERGELPGRRRRRERRRGGVARVELALEVVRREAAHARGGEGEALLDELVGEAQNLEDLGGVIPLHRGDAHLGHDGDDARRDRAVVVGAGLLRGERELAAPAQVADAVVRQIGVDAARRVAHEAREVVGAEGVARLHHEVRARAQAAANEVVVHASEGEQGRDRRLAGAGAV